MLCVYHIAKLTMPDLLLCIQFHQPIRLRRYTVFDTGEDYFDLIATADFTRTAAKQTYLPLLSLLTAMAKKHRSKFTVSLSLTGPTLTNLSLYAPEVLEAIGVLAAKSTVSLAASSSHHTVAVLDHPQEFCAQVATYREVLHRTLGVTTTMLVTPDLIHTDSLNGAVAGSGITSVLIPSSAGGWPRLTGPAGSLKEIPIDLGRSAALAGNLAGSQHQTELSAELTASDGSRAMFIAAEDLVNSDAPMGARFAHFESFVAAYVKRGGRFVSAGDLAPAAEIGAGYESTVLRSGRLPTGDLTHVLGNTMQSNALNTWAKLGARLGVLVGATAKGAPPRAVLEAWRHLGSIDHLSAMSTLPLQAAAGSTETGGSIYDSPYDAYINYMNVLDSLGTRLAK